MTADKFEILKAAVNDGRLLTASKQELERFARTVCLPNAYTHFSVAQWPQITETIRLMLLVRMSEGTQNEALNVARTALKVSRFALFLVVVQILLALPALIETVGRWLSASPPQSVVAPQQRPDSAAPSAK
jgi:hypothetical protein